MTEIHAIGLIAHTAIVPRPGTQEAQMHIYVLRLHTPESHQVPLLTGAACHQGKFRDGTSRQYVRLIPYGRERFEQREGRSHGSAGEQGIDMLRNDGER